MSEHNRDFVIDNARVLAEKVVGSWDSDSLVEFATEQLLWEYIDQFDMGNAEMFEVDWDRVNTENDND